MQRPPINLVWLKRDLRLRDHAALAAASYAGLPTLVFYCFEPSLMEHPDYAARHWRFCYQSLVDIQQQLKAYGKQLFWFHCEVTDLLQIVQQHYAIQKLFAHVEVGVQQTFDRDKAVSRWCKAHEVRYLEYGQDAVIRGQKHRDGWREGAERHLSTIPIQYELTDLNTLETVSHLRQALQEAPLPEAIVTPDTNFQPGGETYAWRYLRSFLTTRHQQYSRQLSKPHLSRKSCSRLSPYLAYGSISVREAFQATEVARAEQGEHFNLKNFHSRLYWRCHYMQKLESGHYLEHHAINPKLDDLDRTVGGPLWEAFAQARTGFPMVDASLRCLKATGWINFRMRAMLVTFTSYALWLDWRQVAHYLAQLFLDFEPGIHYAQIQMQAGLTGYHTLRIFNPNVQATRHDPDGTFIHQWLPELREVPPPLCHQPWKMTAMDQTFYRCELGKDYPAPIVDYDQAVAKNKDYYWAMRHRQEVIDALPAVWRQFCVREDIAKYQKMLKKPQEVK
ncbi:MAG: FAD-binding domain-containing protein [Bacteroidota bacterium]